MKPLTIAAAALAVFFLVMSMIVSAPAPAPADGMDRCLMCHPKAHPDGWTQSAHITELQSGAVPMSECTRCHDVQYCTTCHAQYRAMQQQGSAQQQPSTP